MILKKRGAVYAVIALMLCIAVYLNWSYSRADEEVAGTGDEPGMLGQVSLVDGDDVAAAEHSNLPGDYFAEARLSRQKARDEAVGILSDTVENVNASEEARSAANDSIQVLAECALKEARIENLVIAKGYMDCVVFINDSGINVIIPKPAEGLTSADSANIKEIVMEETGVKAENIKIIETV